MPLSSEPLLARVKLAELKLHEPLAARWAAETDLLREAFAEAYRAVVGVHPAQRAQFRRALEDLRDGRTRGEVTVESLVGRLRFM